VLITSKAGTWELLHTALQKQMRSSRQPEAAVVTYHPSHTHTVGENGLGLNKPRHYCQILQEVLYQQ